MVETTQYRIVSSDSDFKLSIEGWEGVVDVKKEKIDSKEYLVTVKYETKFISRKDLDKALSFNERIVPTTFPQSYHKLVMIIDKGASPDSLISDLLSDISALQKACGGNGLTFSMEDILEGKLVEA